MALSKEGNDPLDRSPTKIFCSFDLEDEALLRKLEQHLSAASGVQMSSARAALLVRSPSDRRAPRPLLPAFRYSDCTSK